MILFCDFDGTLSREEIPCDFERNLEAVKRFREAGNLFVISTGRSVPSLTEDFPDFWDYIDYVVVDNGAACLDKDRKVLFECTFPEEVAKEVVEYVDSRSSGHHVGYTFYKNCEEYDELSGAQTKVRIWFDDDELMERTEKELSERYPDLKFYTGHHAALALINFEPDGDFVCLLDVAASNAGKERALERLAAMHESEHAVAVGDGNNDIVMLKEFDGYVMSSAASFFVEEFDEEHRADSVADLIDRLMSQFNAEQMVVIRDIERQLGCRVRDLAPTFYSDGATDATVFGLGGKYLVKMADAMTVRTQKEFLSRVPEGVFQKLLCSNESLGYECFEFIEGEHFDGSLIDPKEAVNQIAAIVESYPEYPHDKYGFLNDEKASWREFLLDEIDYAYRTITDVSQEKVLAAVEKIGFTRPKQYLMHGDFGTHNFLLSNGKIRVIDPMPVVGDRLYDFYFAILSDTDIFAELGMDYYMNFFGEYEPEYKKALLIVALYVRMSRAAVYDKDNLDKYKKLYAKI